MLQSRRLLGCFLFAASWLQHARAAPSRLSDFSLGTNIADIPFELPSQSYAGLLPLAGRDKPDTKYFFWLWEAEESGDSGDLILWMNGGPGCSSLEGLFQGNGPINLLYNTTKPGLNPHRWTQLANVLYVDQPAGVGFSTGKSTLKNEGELAADFYGFLVSFFQTFPTMKNKRLFFAGESYAAVMQANIIDLILSRPTDSNRRNGINYQGWTLHSPALSSDLFLYTLPAVPWAKSMSDALQLNVSFANLLDRQGDMYGLKDYLPQHLVYPPTGYFYPPTKNDWDFDKFDPYALVSAAAKLANKCYTSYKINEKCPGATDPLGYPLIAETASAKNWINDHPNFKKALHVDPKTEWLECKTAGDVFPKGGYPDNFPDPGPFPMDNGMFAKIIDRTPSTRVVVAHGLWDGHYLALGNELAIQNMSWGGKIGFQTKPDVNMRRTPNPKKYQKEFGANGLGPIHHERGLTLFRPKEAGHILISDLPEPAMRLMAYQLGQLSFAQIIVTPQ